MIYSDYGRGRVSGGAGVEGRVAVREGLVEVLRTLRAERCKQLSLKEQAQSASERVGALLRRVESEAPELTARVRGAVEALQLLNLHLSIDADDGAVRGGRRHAVAEFF